LPAQEPPTRFARAFPSATRPTLQAPGRSEALE
jgi:hypothetical protein